MRWLSSAVIVLVATLGVPGCTGDADDPAAPGPPGAVGGAQPHHGEGSGMEPDTLSVDDVAALGPGPEMGDEWTIWFGLNVCGRFVELPAAGPVDGITMSEGGTLVVAPLEGDPVGHGVDVAGVLALLDVEADTGSLGFPADVVPAELEYAGGSVELAGAELRTGQYCGSSPAEVQVWVYSPEAVVTGDGVGVVVTDPGEVPLAADGMAVTVAFAPTSSLPTLPPAALLP